MLIGIIRKGQNFPQDQKTGKYLNEIIRQFKVKELQLIGQIHVLF